MVVSTPSIIMIPRYHPNSSNIFSLLLFGSELINSCSSELIFQFSPSISPRDKKRLSCHDYHSTYQLNHMQNRITCGTYLLSSIRYHFFSVKKQVMMKLVSMTRVHKLECHNIKNWTKADQWRFFLFSIVIERVSNWYYDESWNDLPWH